MLVKICGTTNASDAQFSAAAGADYVGMVVAHPASPRSITLEKVAALATATSLISVAVTVNLDLVRLLRIGDILSAGRRCGVLQLHGDEEPELVTQLVERGETVWTAIHGNREEVLRRAEDLTEAGSSALLLDARTRLEEGTIYGGTGQNSDWALARELVDLGYRVVLAGGLSPENVAEAVAAVRPWMVDVVSGVEASKGVKDPEKVKDFVLRAQSAG